MPMGDVILHPSLVLNHMGVLVAMSLENRIQKLIDKHQNLANHYHRTAEGLWPLNKTESVRYDALAHPHEQIAAELRMLLRHV